MNMWIFRAAAVGFFTAGCVLGIDPNHYVAAGFCLLGGWATVVRSIVVAKGEDTYHEADQQHGF